MRQRGTMQKAAREESKNRRQREEEAEAEAKAKAKAEEAQAEAPLNLVPRQQTMGWHAPAR
jgi:hypothetical protein